MSTKPVRKAPGGAPLGQPDANYALGPDVDYLTDHGEGHVNVFEFIPHSAHAAIRAGTNAVNLSSYVQAAFDTGLPVKFPEGTFRCNVVSSGKIVVKGAGSTLTRLVPHDPAIAAITHRNDGGWSYHSEVRNVGFYGTDMTGVGFTFARTNPADYQTNDEYANNVKFLGCNFFGLHKGVQFPFGNIGSEFYSCGFAGNKYGVYSLDAKFGGMMHAGNKYFYAGEFHSNDVAVYVHNGTTDGFGAVTFDGTVFEHNKIAVYFYVRNSGVNPSFTNVWNEVNGQALTPGGTVTIDAWTGSTRSDQTIPMHAFVFDGERSGYTFRSGAYADGHIVGPKIRVIVEKGRTEGSAGFGGAPTVVDEPDSELVVIDPESDGSLPRAARNIVTGAPFFRRSEVSTSQIDAATRWYFTRPRYAKSASFGSGVSETFRAQKDLGEGAFPVTGTVVSDGVIYDSCNEYVVPFTGAAGEFVAPLAMRTALAAGWWVFTVDVKVVSGDPIFYVWNLGNSVVASQIVIPEAGKWHTVAGMAEVTASVADEPNLYVNGTAPTTFRLSAYQFRRFENRQDAEAFIASGAYVEPGASAGGGDPVVSLAADDSVKMQLVEDIGARRVRVLDSENASGFGTPYADSYMLVGYTKAELLALSANSRTGTVYYVTDAAADGSGCLVYATGGFWKRVSDDAQVT